MRGCTGVYDAGGFRAHDAGTGDEVGVTGGGNLGAVATSGSCLPPQTMWGL